MTSPQFEHAVSISELIENSITHMEVKWRLYQSIYYLPDTDVFDKTLETLRSYKNELYGSQWVADWIDRQITGGTSLAEIDPTLFCGLYDLRDRLYYKIEHFSDVINALNYGFLNRLLGAVATEPTLGMEIASRQFGGIQLVYNATEALMKDYVESVKGLGYNGIVVFGFRNRAVTYPPLVVHPSYAEHDLEYLMILAHEAYHVARVEISGETADELSKIEGYLQKQLMDIAPLYLPETILDKNAPDEWIAKQLADDIMADIYATIVAGEAYPKISCEYYLPILSDTMVQPVQPYSSFVIGSLKIRVAVTTLEKLNWKGDGIGGVIASVKKRVQHWETLSENIALKQPDKDKSKTLEFSDIKKRLDSVCYAIDKEDIPAKMSELIEQPYYPKDEDKREELQRRLREVKGVLEGEPTPADMAEIWKDGVRPRHLISLLSQEKRINRNAVLIAMGYHKNILDRFRHP